MRLIVRTDVRMCVFYIMEWHPAGAVRCDARAMATTSRAPVPTSTSTSSSVAVDVASSHILASTCGSQIYIFTHSRTQARSSPEPPLHSQSNIHVRPDPSGCDSMFAYTLLCIWISLWARLKGGYAQTGLAPPKPSPRRQPSAKMIVLSKAFASTHSLSCSR